MSFLELKTSGHDDVTWPLDIQVFEVGLLCQPNTWPSYYIFMLTFGPTVNNEVSVVFMNSLGSVTAYCSVPHHGNRRPFWDSLRGMFLALLLTRLRVKTSIHGTPTPKLLTRLS